jgi:small membrane protein
VLIKVLLLLAIAVVVLIGMRAPTGARHLALRRIGLAGFAAFAALSVLFPDAWNEAADFVGVGRGSDLLLYGLIIAFLLSLVTMYRRHREMERRLTLLARRLAIDEAIGQIPSPGTSRGDDRA